jgi:hypothetical protein
MEREYTEGVIGERAGWIRDFAGGKTKAYLLSRVGNGHNFMHLGEAWCVRSLLGLRLPI